METERRTVDPSRLCRTCNAEASRVSPLFTRDTDDGPGLGDMLTSCTNLKILEVEGFPNSICDDCVAKLKTAFQFKQQCETADRHYKQLRLKSSFGYTETTLPHDKPSNYDYIEILDDNSTIFTCRECCQGFNTLRRLKDHKLTHLKCGESNFDTRCYICVICNTFVKQSIYYLKRHLLIHVKDSPFNCETCNRSFLRADLLTRHEKRCSGLKTYRCNFCRIGYRREDSCLVHQKIHLGQEVTLPTMESIENVFEFYRKTGSDEGDQNEMTSISSCLEESDEEDSEGDSEVPNEKDPRQRESPIVTETVILRIEDYKEDPLELNDEKDEAIDDDNLEENPLSDRDPEYSPSKNRKRRKVRRPVGRPSKKPPKTLRCPDCGKEFNDPIALEEHASRHACNVCDRRFARFNHLKRHLRSHDATKKSFRCDVCEKSYSRRDNLRAHKRTHGEPADLKGKGDKHREKVEKRFQCEVCLKVFTTERYRDVHLRGHSEENGFRCKVCEKSFLTKSHLTEHIKFHMDSSKKFLCSECGQRFVRHDYLVIHMRRHRGEKPFKCKYCGKGFPRTTDLNVHVRYHTGEKTHLCVICGRGFGRAYNLTVHMRTHTGEKPYQCTYCSAAFAQGNDLKAHIRRHTGERFRCDLCDQSYLMGYLLTQHKRNVHGLDVTSKTRRLNFMRDRKNSFEEEPTTVSLVPPETDILVIKTEIKQE